MSKEFECEVKKKKVKKPQEKCREKKRKLKKCSYIVRKNDWKALLLIIAKEPLPNSSYGVPFCLIFFPTFSRCWDKRLDLAMISILPQEMFKLLINIY